MLYGLAYHSHYGRQPHRTTYRKRVDRIRRTGKWRAEQNAKRKAIEAEEKKKHKLHNDAIYKKITELIEQARLQHIANDKDLAAKSLTDALAMLVDVKKISGLNLKKFTSKRKEIEYLLTLYKHT